MTRTYTCGDDDLKEIIATIQFPEIHGGWEGLAFNSKGEVIGSAYDLRRMPKSEQIKRWGHAKEGAPE